jgi:hypothetical protein
MALWGTADSLYSVGTVTVDYTAKTITGSGTSFTAAGISTGDVITIGAGGTFGSAVISAITSDTLISIAKTQSLSGEVIAGVAYSLSEKPIYTLEDSSYLYSTDPQSVVYGVDKFEIATIAPGASGLSTQYGGIHAGWVGVQTYVDMHGNLRVKSETLVAMSEITSGTNATFDAPGDADDDEIFADAIITIISQPESVGIGTTEDAVFVVETSVTPSYAPLDYQWFEDGSEISDGGDYSGATTPILTVANDDDKDGNEYNVVITSGDASITSGIATLTYV